MTELEKAKQLDWELQCYGYTQEKLRAMLDDDITAKLTGDYTMVAASFLSNAQEELEMGYNEGARKSINIAKFILFNYIAKDDE
jgi:hypothetical protein